jgi:hypothetical protein
MDHDRVARRDTKSEKPGSELISGKHATLILSASLAGISLGPDGPSPNTVWVARFHKSHRWQVVAFLRARAKRRWSRCAPPIALREVHQMQNFFSVPIARGATAASRCPDLPRLSRES